MRLGCPGPPPWDSAWSVPQRIEPRPRPICVLWVVIRREAEAYDAAASLVCDHHLPDLIAGEGRSIRPDDFGGGSDGLLTCLGIAREDRSVLILDVIAIANIEEVERHWAPSSLGRERGCLSVAEARGAFSNVRRYAVCCVMIRTIVMGHPTRPQRR